MAENPKLIKKFIARPIEYSNTATGCRKFIARYKKKGKEINLKSYLIFFLNIFAGSTLKISKHFTMNFNLSQMLDRTAQPRTKRALQW
jgi:hypothetical protein